MAAWSEDMTTLTGQTYTNIEVQRSDGEGIVIRHDSGITKVYYREISPELRDHYRQMVPKPAPKETAVSKPTEPAGKNDLPTLSGQVYRNVVVKRIEGDAILIAHDGGLAKVYFSEIPEELWDKFRNFTPHPEPQVPVGTNDLVTEQGRIYRNVQVRNIEPDGLTFHHDGGVTKVLFPLLSEELQKKYEYDPEASEAYQKSVAEAKRQAEKDRAVIRKQNKAAHRAKIDAEPIRIFEVRTEKRGTEYHVWFSVRNYDDTSQEIIAKTEISGPLGIKKFTIPADTTKSGLEVINQYSKPEFLLVTCGSYTTNQPLHW